MLELIVFFFKLPLNQDKKTSTKHSEKLAMEARIWRKDKKRDSCRIVLEESEPQIA